MIGIGGLRERDLDAMNIGTRGRALAARLPHKQETEGSIPSSATTSPLDDYATHNED